MKVVYTLFALAALAFAHEPYSAPPWPTHTETTVWTVITSTTVCPVTSTHTDVGSQAPFMKQDLIVA